MDVCLSHFGFCNYISPKHACIFYDEVKRAPFLALFRSYTCMYVQCRILCGLMGFNYLFIPASNGVANTMEMPYTCTCIFAQDILLSFF